MRIDEGFMYGIGAFETIAAENKNLILLDEHLDRLNATLEFLKINKNIKPCDIDRQIFKRPEKRVAIKIMVSLNNTIFDFRKNPYREEDYDTGFRLRYSEILRNDTSPLTYHKTLNYAENIIEKRRNRGYHEAIYLNRRNEICEGTVTNIFFVKCGKIRTPKLSCGLLPGIMRGFLLKNYDIEECIILPDEIAEYNECFVTNSLMGIMPVQSLGNTIFSLKKTAVHLRKEYMQKFNIFENISIQKTT